MNWYFVYFYEIIHKNCAIKPRSHWTRFAINRRETNCFILGAFQVIYILLHAKRQSGLLKRKNGTLCGAYLYLNQLKILYYWDKKTKLCIVCQRNNTTSLFLSITCKYRFNLDYILMIPVKFSVVQLKRKKFSTPSLCCCIGPRNYVCIQSVLHNYLTSTPVT